MGKISKGHNSVKMYVEFHENILDGIKVIEPSRFPLE